MCLAVPAVIIEVKETTARVRMMGVETIVHTMLLEDVTIGDYVLVHTGFAIEKIDSTYYNELEPLFDDLVKRIDYNE